MMRDEIIQKRNYSTLIDGDELSLKISSYPVTAKYLAERLATKGNSICELCCGVGVSLIEFSRKFETVIGIDNDTKVIKSARTNLRLAGINNCDLIVGSVDDPGILNEINTDIVAYDIPYWSNHEDNLTTKNPDLNKLFKLISLSLTKNIVIYSPPGVSVEDITALASNFEYQEVWIDGKHDRNFIYFGSLVQAMGHTKITF